VRQDVLRALAPLNAARNNVGQQAAPAAVQQNQQAQAPVQQATVQ
jgi:hypothetical protein